MTIRKLRRRNFRSVETASISATRENLRLKLDPIFSSHHSIRFRTCKPYGTKTYADGPCRCDVQCLVPQYRSPRGMAVLKWIRSGAKNMTNDDGRLLIACIIGFGGGIYAFLK